MKYEINIDQLGETLCNRARQANKEIIKYYGSANASLEARKRLISQVQIIRDIGIPIELKNDSEPGKELYTGLMIAGKNWSI